MKKILYPVFLMLVLPLWIFAQDEPDNGLQDSLMSVLEKSTNDSIKARASYHLSYHWSDIDSVKAKGYLFRGKELGKKYPYLQALYYYYEGSLYFEPDSERAQKAYMKGAKLLGRYKTKDAYLFTSKCWHDYAALLQRKDQETAYLEILVNKVIPMAKLAGDSVVLAKDYHDVALAFMNTGQSEKAGTYYNEAIKILEKKANKSTVLVMNYISASINSLHQDSVKNARALLDKTWPILSPFPKSTYLPEYYKAEGLYYKQIKQYEKAAAFMDKGIAIAIRINRKADEENINYEKYKVYDAQKKYEAARKILLYLTTQKYTMGYMANRIRVYGKLADVNKKLNNLEQAYYWQEKYIKTYDSANVVSISSDINELELKYKKAENEKRITILNAEKQKAVMAASNGRLYIWLFGLVSGLLLIIAFLGWMYYSNKRKLAEQKIKQIEQQRQIELNEAIGKGEQQERHRVARDLHDGLGGMLASVKINLSHFALEEQQTKNAELNRIISQLDDSASELRRIAQNMMPETLLRFGLETSLKDLCERLMTDNLRIYFQSFDIQDSISIQNQITIYRIAQELLTNSVRHSNASEIMLQCSQNNHSFFITVEDNGRGFDTGLLEKKTGMGLNNIQNRIGLLSGKMEIVSGVQERGTTINIELSVTT